VLRLANAKGVTLHGAGQAVLPGLAKLALRDPASSAACSCAIRWLGVEGGWQNAAAVVELSQQIGGYPRRWRWRYVLDNFGEVEISVSAPPISRAFHEKGKGYTATADDLPTPSSASRAA
jgi:hypothetical protein